MALVGLMDGVPFTFWGKLRRDEAGSVVCWHPLIDHCADVAAVGEALLEMPLWQARIASLARLDRLDETTRARLCVLIALHDLGKLNLGFQAKGRRELGDPTGHVREAIAALGQPCLIKALEPLGAWGEGAFGLLVAAICHHGRPHTVDESAASYQASWWRPRSGLDPSMGAEALVDACRRWFPRAFEEGVGELACSGALEHAFAGLVMLADWIGSDTSIFPYTEPSDADRLDTSRGRAQAALRAMGIRVDHVDRLDVHDRGAFARVAPPGYEPRPAQAAVVGVADALAASVCVLESETGSGKTEAALAHFIRLYSAGQVDGLYFALPTRTAATQLFERVRTATQRAFQNPPPVVLAVPGYVQVDDVQGQRLPDFEVLWPDTDRFRHRGWAAEQPKRYLAGAIVVGTVDQVLLSSLMVSHAHLRATALLRHLLVVDEVHASDAYMNRILEAVLHRHTAAGGHALLLSATLAAEARERLLASSGSVTPVRLSDAEVTPYPLVTQRLVPGPTHLYAAASDITPKSVSIQMLDALEDVENVAALAIAASLQGAKVLVVKNTVVECVATQRAAERQLGERAATVLLTCQGVNAPHHARYARADRVALDRALEARIGKARPLGGCLVVATQTVQQSLDIDADLLVTDLCPVDVLLQRIGRLHRHERGDRPAAFAAPRAVVVVPQRRDLGLLLDSKGHARHHHGLGSVYSDLRVLEATWRLLEAEPTWRIPQMNRRLVERGLHSEILTEITRERGVRWAAHEAEILGETRGHARQAELNLVRWDRAYSETAFPSSEDERISSRLGEGDRRVAFASSPRGPFGYPVRELTIRASWTRGVGADISEATNLTPTAAGFRFDFGSKSFTYDRLGLRPFKPEEDDDDDGP
jgi:CRISPR-associated endonuclease/helicase Cas3